MEDWKDREVRQLFYQSREWKDLREYVLSNEPFCRKCKEEGLLVPAQCVDHITDIQDVPELRLKLFNCQPLCNKCHSKKTSTGRQSYIKKAKHINIKRAWKI